MKSSTEKKNNREDKARQLRLLQIVDMVQGDTFPNTTDFRERFEVSRSTIMRDIDFLKDRYRVPLEYSSENKGYYLTDPNYTIPSFLLTEGELFTLHIILPLVEQYKGTPLEPVFESIMEQLVEMLPKDVEIQTSFHANQVRFISNPQPRIDEKIFLGVLKGIQEGKTLEFEYRSIKRQEYIGRKFNPYQIVCQRGDWYVLGFCHRHKDFRVYNLARMQNLQLKEEFEREEDFELTKYIDPSFGVWAQNKKFVVELVFSKDVNTYIMERKWHINQLCRQEEDGSVHLRFETNQFDETLHWVMSFGSQVKVINPPELREKVLEEIISMGNLYKS